MVNDLESDRKFDAILAGGAVPLKSQSGTATMTIERAHRAIGAYFCTFSALDRELGETVKVIFHLQQHEAANTIIAALGDFARKARLVGAAVQIARQADGSETTEAWKTKAASTIKEILGCNEPDRVMLAHSFLEPNEDASVKLTPLRLAGNVLKNKPETWKESDFQKKIDQLRDLTLRLQQIKYDLSTLKVTMSGLGWMTVDAYQVPAARTAVAAILSPSSEDWLAGSTNEDKRD
jgi:hypothetical protein